jgi:DNA-binding XRE family transcriptional regulator
MATPSLFEQLRDVATLEENANNKKRIIEQAINVLLITLGANVQYYRLQKDMTTRELAQIAGTDRMMIERIESGQEKTRLTITLMFRIAIALEVTVVELTQGIISLQNG